MLTKKSLLTLALFFMVIGGFVALIVWEISSKSPREIIPERVKTQLPRQIRTGVQKDLWIDGGQVRFHHRVTSPRSILTAEPKGKTFELIEEMQGMTCYFQKRIETGEKPHQEVQWFQSNQGRYLYASQRFDANQVLLACFKLPGKTLKTDLDFKDAFLRGGARRFSISLKEHPPHFHAENFKAYVRGHAVQ